MSLLQGDRLLFPGTGLETLSSPLCLHLVRQPARLRFGQLPGDAARTVRAMLVGPSGAGKTALISRFCKGRFLRHHEATVGSEFTTAWASEADELIQLQLWDCAQLSFLHFVQIVVGVFSLGSLESLHTVARSLRKLHGMAFCLVGTHADQQELSEDQVAQEASKLGCHYHLVSCLTGEGVSEVFEEALEAYLHREP